MIEEPKIEKVDHHGTTMTHPAFAQIGASRVSGGRTLYGSDFLHQNYVSIKLNRSKLKRSLSQDWHFGGEELFEIEMSEAQWATFVSSMNVGHGVPCTISHIDRKAMPGIPFRTQDSEFKNDVRDHANKSVDHLKALLKTVEANTVGLSKARQNELLQPIKDAITEISSNLPFVADAFDKHVETKIEAAKVEMHGYMAGVLHSAGLQALTEKQTPVLLTTNEVQPRFYAQESPNARNSWRIRDRQNPAFLEICDNFNYVESRVIALNQDPSCPGA